MKYNYDEDGVAFYFFLLTVLAIYLLVGTWLWIVSPRKSSSKSTASPADGNGDKTVIRKVVECSCPGCQAKRTSPIGAVTKKTDGGKWQRASLAVAAVLFALVLRVVWNAQLSYVQYDPFSILQVSTVCGTAFDSHS